jgi:hypothetical protein
MPRGRTNGRSGEYRHAAENFGCVRERFLHLHLLHQQKAGLSALCESTFRECCALHEWPECESRTAEIWGAMIG